MIYHKISSMYSQFTPQHTITSFDQALYQETSLLSRRGTAGRAAFSRFGSARPFFAFLLLLLLLLLCGASTCLAQRCGGQAGGAVCADNLCCSQYGYCGSTSNYCGTGCQSGPCTGSASGGCSPSPFDQYCSQYDYYCRQYLSSTNSSSAPTPISANNSISIAAAISSIITSAIFDQFLSRRNSAPANGFYTYDAFLAAAAAYAGFGTTGSSDVQKRELAAFFANVAHETGSGQYVEEINKDTYCDTSFGIPCASGQQYYGRGPIQLTWNYNYKAAGDAIGFNGIKNPGIVASDPDISFKTVVWYWMTQASPTCHDAIVNNNGFSATINAINGALECGSNPSNPGGQRNRIQLYESFCDTLGVDPGSNLSC